MAVVIDVAVVQIGVVSVLFGHAELGNASLSVTVVLWLALILESARL